MGIESLIKKAERVLIFSGEGERGIWEVFTGRRTIKAIKARLSRERCGGDRWAGAWFPREYKHIYDRFDMDTGEILDTREVDDLA